MRDLLLDYAEVRRIIVQVVRREPQPAQVLTVSRAILARKATPPDKPLAYVVQAIRTDWAEWQQWFDEGEAGAA